MVKENYWFDKRVFITGATGFLGAHLAEELLTKGANITVLRRDHVARSYFDLKQFGAHAKVINGDLENYRLIERTLNEYEIETVFHVGAQAIVGASNRSPLPTFEANIKGTWNVLEAARNSAMVNAIVVASSDKAYGLHDKLPYTEEVPLQGRHPYDASKSCCDILAQTFFKTYNMPITITRCGNLYGPGDLHFNRIVPETCKSLVFGRNPVIRSDGTFKRDYFYIKDAVAAYLLLGEKTSEKKFHGEAFNFGTETPLTVMELFNKLIKVSGKTHLKPVIKNEVNHEIKDQYLSCEKAKKLLNWRPSHELDKALAVTYKWYEDFLAPLTKQND